ncbi:hypothetical protein HG530_015620 [Fusarium avenaceum]|nr:hypothetical protein HG530_015620 [Fusarium avenaceum]
MLARNDFNLGHALLQSSLQLGLENLLKISTLGVAVKDLHKSAASADAKAADRCRLDISTDRACYHDMLKTTKILSETEDDFGEGYGTIEVTNGAIACARVAGWCVAAGNGDGAVAVVRTRYDISQPGVESFRGSINCGVRAVDGNASLGKA